MDYNIIMPSKPKIVSEEGNKGTYEIEGLYSGYGHTLGNSLRRVILSSMPGSAITTIKMEGASHEFATVPGIKEDFINIILNLKNIKFKVHTDEPQKVTISVKGAKKVTAKDIKVPTQVEVLNTDQHVATLTGKDAKLELELTIEKGLGYVPRESLHKDKVGVGTVVVDAVFSPVSRVNYEVEDMRVGDRTDYNRLRILIETDGTISPNEALEKSIKIMISHLKAIIGFQEEEPEIEKSKIEDLKKEAMETTEDESNESKEDPTEIMKTRLDELQFSSRTLNALSVAGIRTIGGLARKKEEDLLEMEGVGKKTIQEIRRALGNYGLILK